MRASEQCKHIGIFLKSLVMVGFFCYVPIDEKLSFFLFNQHRDLCGLNSSTSISTDQRNERMILHEFKDLFFVLFFIVRIVVHRITIFLIKSDYEENHLQANRKKDFTQRRRERKDGYCLRCVLG